MHVKEVTVSLAYTHNLGNFQSVRFGVSETRGLDAGDNPDEVYAVTYASARDQLLKQYHEMLERLQPESVSMFPGG